MNTRIIMKYLRISLFLLLSIGFLSCGNDFGDVNVNPNAPTVTNPDYLFTDALIKGVQMDANRDLGVWAGLMSSDEGLTRSSDVYSPGELAINTWKETYAIIGNLVEIEKMVKDDAYNINRYSMTRIWKAYLFNRLTDMYGDIPYSEAAKGNSTEIILDPKYDTQESVYIDLLNELKESVEDLTVDASLGSFGAADVIYKGDITKWKKFGNSLRLRMALRLINVNPALAETIVSEIMTDNVLMETEADGFHFQFNSTVQPATYYFYAAGLARSLPSKFLIELLYQYQDPRLAIYAQHPVKGDSIAGYRGMPFDLTVDERITYKCNFNTTSRVGSYFLRNDVKGFTMSYAEVCFMKAEAALRGWGATEDMAEPFYIEGVTAAMTYFKTFTTVTTLQIDPFTPITQEQIDTYLANAGKFEGTFDEKLDKIITQRWLTLYQEGGYEAFALVRATHIPHLEHFDNSLIDMDNEYVQRMPYPIEEYALNGIHLDEALQRQGTKVWWSK